MPSASPLPRPRARAASISGERARRLRVAWFVLGTLFGLALSMFVHPHFGTSDDDFDVPAGESPEQPAAAPEPKEHSEALPPETEISDETIAWPRTVEATIASGDTLLDLLTEQGLTSQSAHEVMRQLKPAFDPRDLKSGQTVSMVLDHDDSRQERDAAQVAEMSIVLSNLEQVILKQQRDGSYRAERSQKKVVIRPVFNTTRITSSFSLAAQRAGVPAKAVNELIKNYSYDVDFQRDIQVGDQLSVLYEQMMTEDGVKVSTGQVLYAVLKTDGREKRLYRFKGSDGQSRFYNERGESIIKKLLKTPIDGARISSGFGMRFHPVLGYSRMHRGIDFAAPMGTPIFAAGDGVIDYAGPAGGYGNLVKIRHNATWSTAYGHMSRFASGLHKGMPVHQGQVIAYVGMAGVATGPHLHYEILKEGAQINPNGVKFAGGDRLEGRDMAAFKAQQRKVLSDVAGLGNPNGKQIAGR